MRQFGSTGVSKEGIGDFASTSLSGPREAQCERGHGVTGATIPMKRKKRPDVLRTGGVCGGFSLKNGAAQQAAAGRGLWPN